MKLSITPPTIRQLLHNSLASYGDLPALAVVHHPPLTYREMAASITRLAHELRKRGVRRGDRVAIYAENSPNWVMIYLAVTTSGAVAVPILPGFPDAALRHIVQDPGSKMIFVGKKQKEVVSQFLSIDILDIETPIPPMEGFRGPDDFLAGFEEPDPDDLAVIIYTSGTTGHSKGVMLSHRNLVMDVMLSIERFPIDQNDRFLSILPLSHTFEATGGLLCPLAVGVFITYLEGLPTPKTLLAAMEAVRPTGVLSVPLVIDKIYRKRILPEIQKKKLLSFLYKMPPIRRFIHRKAGAKLKATFGGALRFFMFGGAPLNEDVERFLREADIGYSTGYGLTETSPIVTINPFGRVKMGSCGQPIPGIEVKIHDPDPQTGVGEILVKGPIVMQGYYNNPEATRQAFLEGGWLRTGDLGVFDEENYLYIKGRSKNLILGPSGENIYPEAIEQLYLQNPYIQEIVVYEDEGRVIAKVYPDFDQFEESFSSLHLSESEKRHRITETVESIRKEINQKLPMFSWVQKIIISSEPFEKTPTNKVKRYLYTSKP